jgi:DNA replication protein DnaC
LPASGIINNGPQQFSVNGLQYNKLRKPAIVSTCPFIPVDNNDESSAYSTLLLHTPWSYDGEAQITNTNTTAVDILANLIQLNHLPEYVLPMLVRQAASTFRTTNQTIPQQQAQDYDIQDDLSEDEHYEMPQMSTVNENNDNSSILQIQISNTDEVRCNISTNLSTYYKNFIKNAQDNFMAKIRLDNQISQNDHSTNNSAFNGIHNVSNYDERVQQLAADIQKRTVGQKRAYDKAISHLSGANPTPLFMFISGEGGTGKSFIIALIREFTRLRYGKQLGLFGSVATMAPTGCAANLVEGQTWQASYGVGKNSDQNGKNNMTQESAKNVGERFRGTKLIIIDEISMKSLENLADMSYRHQQGMLSLTDDIDERNYILSKPFGGIGVLITGDLHQLKPIGGTAIYTKKSVSGKALNGQIMWRNTLNEYEELTQNYRFKDDTSNILEPFLKGARLGKVDRQLLLQMNTRLVLSRQEAIRLAHPLAIWIAHKKTSVQMFNNCDLQDKIRNGIQHFRMVAYHTSATDIHPSPGIEERKILYQTNKKKGGAPTHIDLAIGTRVSCVQNLGTQIGILHITKYYKISTKYVN